jgi:hypothetical protein
MPKSQVPHPAYRSGSLLAFDRSISRRNSYAKRRDRRSIIDASRDIHCVQVQVAGPGWLEAVARRNLDRSGQLRGAGAPLADLPGDPANG